MKFTELEKIEANGTEEFVFNQTMMRIKDPKISLDFYQRILGMTLLKTLDFPEMKFTLYFLGYLREENEPVPGDALKRTEYVFNQKALLELTHNWGTESDVSFSYHDGNSEPRGFGHIGISVPDVYQASKRFAAAPHPAVSETLREALAERLDRRTAGEKNAS